MKKIIVSLIASVLVSLFSQAASATEPVCEEIKKCQNEVCEMVKACSSPAPAAETKPKTIWREEYVCSGNYDPLKSKKSGKCVCKEPEKNHAFALARPWEEVPNKVDPSNANVKYHRLYVRCDLSAQAVLEATRTTMNVHEDDIHKLQSDMSDANGRVGKLTERVDTLESDRDEHDRRINELKTDRATKLEVSKKADKADLDKKADTEWVKRWVATHSSRLFGGVSAVFLPMDSGMAGMGMLDVGWGKLYGDGTWGWQASLRALYAPGSFSSGLSRSNGQVWGGGAATHVTISPWENKRLQILVGGSYTQFWTPNENLGRAAFLGLVEGGVRIPLSDEVGLRFLIGIGDEAHRREDGTRREHGPAGMLNVGIVF